VATRRVSKNLQQGRAGGEGTGIEVTTPVKKSQETRYNLDPESFFVNRFWAGDRMGSQSVRLCTSYISLNLNGKQTGTRGSWSRKKQKQMSSTKASSVRSKLLLWSGNLSRLILWWVTADRLLRANSTPSAKSLMYKKEKKTSSSPIM